MNLKSKSEKLNNDLRPKIVNYIQIHPGSPFSDIQTIFDLPESTLRYHLRYLEKNGEIYSDSKKRIYYPTEHKEKNRISNTQMSLINSIKKHPGITQKELAAKTKINRLTIRKNINLLVENESVTITRIGNEVHHFYIYPEELEKIKTLRLITKLVQDKIDEDTYWDLRRNFIGGDEK
ncbi:MAG: winged helix-turn-helix transcriptional regulator [Thermoplasmata archaeon]|nr:MAG: winged helix-turn-helix transcriptional regulator [Thermoplasmata archaeon]